MQISASNSDFQSVHISNIVHLIGPQLQLKQTKVNEMERDIRAFILFFPFHCLLELIPAAMLKMKSGCYLNISATLTSHTIQLSNMKKKEAWIGQYKERLITHKETVIIKIVLHSSSYVQYNVTVKQTLDSTLQIQLIS